MKKKAIAAGHICLDITPAFPESMAGKSLIPGQLIHMEGITLSIGGAVPNTGLSMRLLGAETKLMGKIGKDEFGKVILDELKKYGSDQDMVISPDESTSWTIAIALPGIDRTLLHMPGTNDTFGADDLKTEELKDAVLFHFGYPTLMKKMYQNRGDDLLKMLRLAKSCGPLVSLDMAGIDPGSEVGRVDWEEILKKTLPFVDFFVPSAEELCYMLDRDLYREWHERAGDGDVCDYLYGKEVRALVDRVLEFGAKTALIKCGASGLYCRTTGKDRMNEICRRLELDPESWIDREYFEPSYVPDIIRSGTGAGDTCIGAYLAAILQGESLPEALHLAAGEGACCVSSYDTLSGLLPMDALKEKIRSGWKKQENDRFEGIERA